jgi:TolB protein
LAALFILTLSIAACSDSTGVWPPKFFERWILFTGQSKADPATLALYGVRADGFGLVKLRDLGLGSVHRWSRDGEQVAFVTNQLWIMRADASGAHPIPNQARCEFTRLSWSPSGDRILGDCGMVESWVIDVSNGTGYSLTQRWGRTVNTPDWSPLGDKILYTAGTDAYVANLDGSGASMVLPGVEQPEWSPDGTRIVFVKPAYWGNQIFVANADGSGWKQLTSSSTSGGSDGWPTWSPDGTRILFSRLVSSVRFDAFLYVMRSNGDDLKRITPDTLLSTHPDW